MEGDRRLSLTVGGLAVASLAALALVILSLSAEQGVFAQRYRLVAYFQNVQGLLPGAPVWLAGKHIGRVESVEFGTLGGEQPPVQVVLQVNEAVRNRLRNDSVASIGTIGLLGDRYVEVSLGTEEGQVLPDGGELGTLNPVDFNVVVAQGTQALDNIKQLAVNLNEVVSDFDAGGGGARLASALEDVGGVMGGVEEIVQQVQKGDGLLHSLVYDQYEGGGVESIERSLATLEGILTEVRHGDGVLHALIYDPFTGQETVRDTLQAGARLNSILAKVDRGDGTLGLLLNDPTLYEDMKLLVEGARRSAVVRTMIRMMSDGEGE